MHRLLLRTKTNSVSILGVTRQVRPASFHYLCVHAKKPVCVMRFPLDKRSLSTASSNDVDLNDNSSDAFSVLLDTEDFSDYYDRPRYPVVDEEIVHLEETRHLHAIPNNKVLEEVTFEKNFERKTHLSIHDVQHAAYVSLEQSSIDKLFPEGLAGETVDEFDHSARYSWMVRPATKFLCRVIESFDKKELSSALDGGKWRPAAKEVVPVHYHGVTDRGEWPASKPSVRYYAQEVVPQAGAETVIDGVLPGIKYVGSEVESWLDKVSDLSATAKKSFPDKILITGERGSGKSTVLNQAVMHARSRGWLCLFIPRGWEYTQSGDYVAPVVYNEDGSPAVFDNPQMSAAVLRGFYRAHADILATLPIRNPAAVFEKYTAEVDAFKNEWRRMMMIPGRENLSFLVMRSMIEGEEDNNPTQDKLDEVVLADFKWNDFSMKTLADLVIFGVAFRKSAGLIAMDLIAELKEVTSVPVLIAVDQWNNLEVGTAFAFDEKEVLGKQLCIPHALQFLSQKKADSDQWKLKNGICMAALSYRHCEGKAQRITYEHQQRSVPLMVKVPVYDSKEFLSAVTFYQAQKILPKSATTQDMLTFRIMTGSNPRHMRKDIADFWLPIECGKMRGEIDDPDFFLGDEDNQYPNRWLLDGDSAGNNNNNSNSNGSSEGNNRRDDRDSRMRDIMDDVVKAGGGDSHRNRNNSSSNSSSSN